VEQTPEGGGALGPSRSELLPLVSTLGAAHAGRLSLWVSARRVRTVEPNLAEIVSAVDIGGGEAAQPESLRRSRGSFGGACRLQRSLRRPELAKVASRPEPARVTSVVCAGEGRFGGRSGGRIFGRGSSFRRRGAVERDGLGFIQHHEGTGAGDGVRLHGRSKALEGRTP
jgi:hypothetical protein